MLGVDDPNWLLSTGAQSAAAIVAIVGGLLVSRVLFVAGERSALLRRRQELMGRLEHLTDQVKGVESFRLGVVRRQIAHAWTRRLVNGRANEDVIKEAQGQHVSGATYGEISFEVRHLAGAVQAMFNLIDRRLARHAVPVTNGVDAGVAALLDDLKSDTALPMMTRGELDLWKLVWRRATNQEEIEPTESATETFGVAPSDHTLGEQEELLERNKELDAELALLEAELNVVDSLTPTTFPKGLRVCVVVLLYFAVVGVALPVYLLTRRPVPGSSCARMLIFLAFASGLLAVLAYIVWATWQLVTPARGGLTGQRVSTAARRLTSRPDRRAILVRTGRPANEGEAFTWQSRPGGI